MSHLRADFLCQKDSGRRRASVADSPSVSTARVRSSGVVIGRVLTELRALVGHRGLNSG